MAADDVTKKATVDTSLNAVQDGHVIMEIQKMGPWMDINVGRDNVRMGATMVPAGKLHIAFPVEGIKVGDTISPEQLAQLMTASVEVWMGACLFFVNQAHEEFGYEEPKKPDDF